MTCYGLDEEAYSGRESQRVRLEDLVQGIRVEGLVAGGPVTILTTVQTASDAFTVVFAKADGSPDHVLALRSSENRLKIIAPSLAVPFDGDAAEYRMAAEAARIRMAGQFDPMVAVTTSDLDPLPHQIDAVYGHLLPKVPLRYLLADDPGAGKTIMAGLYIKELLLRGDLARCLVVAPGGLVEQWQGELRDKFGLRFAIRTRDLLTTTAPGENPFHAQPYLIARMDQLSRSDDLRTHLEQARLDLVVVDEAHRMAAHYFGGELKKTRRYELGELLGRVCEHLLLMTATPHAGKEEDFQLLLALLDGDRFEGRHRKAHDATDVSGLMLRRVKEELLTFEGRRLFPERFAATVPYQLSAEEAELYEQVTGYVRNEMNRADQLRREGEGRRGNTVGFALTVLQRRLASSPEAILRSLERRHARLEARLRQMTWQDAAWPNAEDDPDELASAERETLEEEVLDAATAARTAVAVRGGGGRQAALDDELGQAAAQRALARFEVPLAQVAGELVDVLREGRLEDLVLEPFNGALAGGWPLGEHGVRGRGEVCPDQLGRRHEDLGQAHERGVRAYVSIGAQPVQFGQFPVVDDLELLVRDLKQVAFDLLQPGRGFVADRGLQAPDEVGRSPVAVIGQVPYLADEIERDRGPNGDDRRPEGTDLVRTDGLFKVTTGVMVANRVDEILHRAYQIPPAASLRYGRLPAVSAMCCAFGTGISMLCPGQWHTLGLWRSRDANSVGMVVRSEDPDVPVGAQVATYTGWQSYGHHLALAVSVLKDYDSVVLCWWVSSYARPDDPDASADLTRRGDEADHLRAVVSESPGTPGPRHAGGSPDHNAEALF
jgi:hypothetical protein